MYARIARFADNDLEGLQKHLAREHRDGVLPHVKGVSRVVIMQGDQNLFITVFDTKEALEAEEQKFLDSGKRAPGQTRGQLLGIEHYHVVYDQSGPNAWIPWLEDPAVA